MLESFLPDPENITDGTVMDLLKKLFDLPAAKKLVSEVVNQSSDHEAAFDYAKNQSTEFPADLNESYEIEEPEEDE